MKGFVLLSKSKLGETYRTEDHKYMLSKVYRKYNGKRTYAWTVLKKSPDEETPKGIVSQYLAMHTEPFKDLRLAKSFIREQYVKEFSPTEIN